ncbi:MAG: AGE family epimerase/isomerase [Parvularculaceae bacterium]
MGRASGLEAELQRFIAWFWEACLPHWAERGANADGGFFESLDFDGRPRLDEPRRVRVQSRQIHVFATAARLGRHPRARMLAEGGLDYVRRFASPEDGRRGCVHLLAPDGAILDDRRDLYDQAFLMLACASSAGAFLYEPALALAARTLAFLEAEMKAPGGGYFEDDKATRPRRQNPHMHLFEAMLALYAATGDAEFLGRAAALKAVLQVRFLDARAGALREFFTDDLSAPDPARGDIVEPGHMAEWVWLLESYRSLSGGEVGQEQRLLYRRARELGEGKAGFLVNSTVLGAEPRGRRRLWPQTEYLKASLVMARRGETGAAERAERLVGALFASYLDRPLAGLWCDEFDGQGLPIAGAVPASIVYHLMEAALEAEKHLKEVRA